MATVANLVTVNATSPTATSLPSPGGANGLITIAYRHEKGIRFKNMADVDSNGNGDSCDGVDCEIEQPTDDWSQNLNYGEVVVPDPLQAKDYAISVALLALVVGVLLYSYRMKGESRMWARTETLIVMLYGLSCYFVPNAMYQNFVSADSAYSLSFETQFLKYGTRYFESIRSPNEKVFVNTYPTSPS